MSMACDISYEIGETVAYCPKKDDKLYRSAAELRQIADKLDELNGGK